ncbi:hypothetical protein SRHO_G00158170 [Serrasalmus rhombeus]
MTKTCWNILPFPLWRFTVETLQHSMGENGYRPAMAMHSSGSRTVPRSPGQAAYNDTLKLLTGGEEQCDRF